MVTASKIPVPYMLIIFHIPDPIAPIKSAKIVKNPIQIPPRAAAHGMYLW
jgi:hypothetical protein